MNPLDQLAEIYARRDAAKMTYEARRDEILAPVRDQLAALDHSYTDMDEELDQEIKALEDSIRQDVLSCGLTQQGQHINAVYFRGRVTWDTKRLDILSTQMPQIAECRKAGAPYVTIQFRKGG